MRDMLSGHEGMSLRTKFSAMDTTRRNTSKATEKMMHSRQGRNLRLSKGELASDTPARGGPAAGSGQVQQSIYARWL